MRHNPLCVIIPQSSIRRTIPVAFIGFSSTLCAFVHIAIVCKQWGNMRILHVEENCSAAVCFLPAMDHRQKYPERDELRAKFTRWLETIIQRAKIDYLRKDENHPEIISYEDIPEAELLDLAQCESWPKITRMQPPYDFEEERLTKAFMALPLKRRQVMELLFPASRNSQKAHLLVTVCQKSKVHRRKSFWQ